MRPRTRILENLETVYREAFDRARAAGDDARQHELEWAYVRDQLMLEILLDIRDLFAVTPAAGEKAPTALEQLEQLRRLTRLR